MDNLRRAVFRWRHLVLGAELLVAAGFTGLGWQLLHQARSAADVVTIGAPPPHTSRVPPRYGLVGPPLPRTAAGSVRTARLPSPSSDLLRRLNQDDLDLYHGQWRAIQTLSDGIRRYLERWVLPPLFDPGLRG